MRSGLSIPSMLVLLCSLSGLKAQEVSVNAAFDTSRIFIGDQLNYTITIDQPSGITLSLKPLKDTLCKSIEILSGPVYDSIMYNGDRLKITGKYLVTSFDSGFYQVPPYYAESRTEAGIKRFYSDYSPLEVMRVRIAPPDTTARIFDIIEPYGAPVTVGEIMPWLLLVIIIAAIIWFLHRILKRIFRKKDVPEIIINPDPAHVIAFRDLEKLKEDNLWQKGETKQYYSRLTEILRQYLENRYKVFSLELTTSETLEALVKTGFRKDELYNRLRIILMGADLVKFAKYKPEPAENDQHFEGAWDFVEKTIAVEEVRETNEKRAGKEVKE